MSRIHLFADEAGNFDFSRGRGASRYFILTTVTMSDCSVGDALLDLRRQLAWEGRDVQGFFHATEDKQQIRDEVFGVLGQHEFRVDATIVEKVKTYPNVRVSDLRFHKTAWYMHMRNIAPAISSESDELLVVSASLGTRRQRQCSRMPSTMSYASSRVVKHSGQRFGQWAVIPVWRSQTIALGRYSESGNEEMPDLTILSSTVLRWRQTCSAPERPNTTKSKERGRLPGD